jgi:hypothetical protein
VPPRPLKLMVPAKDADGHPINSESPDAPYLTPTTCAPGGGHDQNTTPRRSCMERRFGIISLPALSTPRETPHLILPRSPQDHPSTMFTSHYPNQAPASRNPLVSDVMPPVMTPRVESRWCAPESSVAVVAHVGAVEG